ncbi:beta-glucanosyltransferase [Zalerion maritima]|uniref:1,3-beta-glucanosyltransferase n=1 Tax=Zalerion maritima TaxID=339359 RepID=A0AAD5RYN8_9PEZI|nr:beta-glucanosyltransferase [Zalerion maritima]
MGRSALATTLVSFLLAGNAAADLPPIIQSGTKFFYENGTQFFMKGIAYQQDVAAAGGESTSDTYLDPLADEDACSRDIPIMSAAGTNTIRTYAIDPTSDHSACMKLLDEAGIYVVSDLSEPSTSINRDDPEWTVELFDRYKAVVDELEQYSNVIGFFAGNEVSNNASNTGASAFVKAAVRDTKAYISDQGYRWMGVGYAANDDDEIREYISEYFNCNGEDESIDFWGYNIYSWCGSDSSFEISGYDKQVEFFSNYSVPVFFAEYGCNTVDGADGRVFDETEALYSDEMTDVFSGGIVYMYFEETNDYGLVSIDSSGDASTMTNYKYLKSSVLAADPSSTASSAYTPTNTQGACPSIQENWAANSILPPTPNSALCECMLASLSCTVTDSTNSTEYGDLFDFVCGEDESYCAGIKADSENGVYGAYSMCNAKHQLAYVLDQYYQAQGSSSDSCDFDGLAEVQSASAASSCDASLSSAASVNSVVATATAGSESSTSGGDDDESTASRLGFSILGGIYISAAMAVGAGMILL